MNVPSRVPINFSVVLSRIPRYKPDCHHGCVLAVVLTLNSTFSPNIGSGILHGRSFNLLYAVLRLRPTWRVLS
eukprot:1550879-Amphidinium_carterae.1